MKASRAAAVICSAYCGYCCAVASALAKLRTSWLSVALDTDARLSQTR